LENADTTPARRAAATRRGERFHALMAAVVARLPFGLPRIVAPSFLGFAIINGFTFSVDLGLLSLGHGVLKWPYPAAVTLSYLTAFALSFVLNRAFNFRSHEALGPQTARYVVAVAINFAVFVLGVGDALTAVGVEYQLARVLSGLGEGVYMYCMMRWVVFRGAPRGLPGPAPPGPPSAGAAAHWEQSTLRRFALGLRVRRKRGCTGSQNGRSGNRRGASGWARYSSGWSRSGGATATRWATSTTPSS
jgi:putative flippase GtrA